MNIMISEVAHTHTHTHLIRIFEVPGWDLTVATDVCGFPQSPFEMPAQ